MTRTPVLAGALVALALSTVSLAQAPRALTALDYIEIQTAKGWRFKQRTHHAMLDEAAEPCRPAPANGDAARAAGVIDVPEILCGAIRFSREAGGEHPFRQARRLPNASSCLVHDLPSCCCLSGVAWPWHHTRRAVARGEPLSPRSRSGCVRHSGHRKEAAMYAQIREYDSIRGGHTADQVCKEIERTGAALFEEIPGFVDYFVLELADGGLLTVSLYEDRAGVEAGKKVSAKWNLTESLNSLPEKPDHVFEGQVRIHHPARKPAAA